MTNSLFPKELSG